MKVITSYGNEGELSSIDMGVIIASFKLFSQGLPPHLGTGVDDTQKQKIFARRFSMNMYILSMHVLWIIYLCASAPSNT